MMDGRALVKTFDLSSFLTLLAIAWSKPSFAPRKLPFLSKLKHMTKETKAETTIYFYIQILIQIQMQVLINMI